MKIEFVAKNYEISEHLRRVTTQKLNKLDKYFKEEGECKIYFKKESKALKTEVMLSYHGNFIRAQEVGDNFYKNIDKVLSKIEGQIRKYRTKFDKEQKNVAFGDKTIFAPSKKAVENTNNVVKTKQFKLQPMTIDEAIEEMELLGHNFFVFCDKDGMAIKILYLRSDGELGLIEPEL